MGEQTWEYPRPSATPPTLTHGAFQGHFLVAFGCLDKSQTSLDGRTAPRTGGRTVGDTVYSYPTHADPQSRRPADERERKKGQRACNARDEPHAWLVPLSALGWPVGLPMHTVHGVPLRSILQRLGTRGAVAAGACRHTRHGRQTAQSVCTPL